MQTPSPRGLQYGLSEILAIVFGVAFILGFSKWLWMRSVEWEGLSYYIHWYSFVFFSGCIFYLIGCSMRNRVPERKLNRFTRILIFTILLLLILSYCYCLWANLRFRNEIVNDAGFPHGWPYPDQVLSHLCDLYNIPYPTRYADGVGRVEPFLYDKVQFTIQMTFAPLFGGICFCIGILMPIRIANKSHRNYSD